MATYQTSYGINKARGLPGQVSTLEESNRITRTVETAAGIAFGQPVQRGTADRGAAILSTGDFLGLAILHVAVAPDAANPDAYPQYSELGIMTEAQCTSPLAAPLPPAIWCTGTRQQASTPT